LSTLPNPLATPPGRQVKRFVGHTGVIHALVFAPLGQRLVSASEDATALVWEVP
jgi:WD40 repeat protein